MEAEKGGDGGRMQGWYPDPEDKVDVRSVYLIRKRCLPIPFLQAFDLPDPSVSCARRDTTIVAPQALTLLNSPESARYAAALAARAQAASATGEGKVDALFNEGDEATQGQLRIQLVHSQNRDVVRISPV